MPVLVWEFSDRGPQSTVETDWQTVFTPEEVRHEAEELDGKLDRVLDSALEQVRNLATGAAPIEFIRAWSIGRALRESSVLEAPELKNEPRHRLWFALARKCRTGIRSDRSLEPDWEALRPSTAREPRREGRRLDYFEMCIWLAEQSFADALDTFGGSVRNVWQMLERPTLRPPVVRAAFRLWLDQLEPPRREEELQPQRFAELMKALRARWPDRGPGSAKRPVHFSEQELLAEMRSVLGPSVDQTG